jgi:hypothetical protein
MRTITKVLVGTVAAGAMAMTSTAPAFAQRDRENSRDSEHSRDRDRDHDRDHGVSTGEVIAGALIVGGIAAVAASIDDNGRYDRRVYGTGRSREAVELCVNAAERRANRRSYRGRSDVTDIRSVDRNRDGFTVRGRIAVNELGRNWRPGDRTYGRGWNGDYRGWNQRYRGWDAGNFTCKVRYGRVVNVDFSGIRGL